MKIRITPLQALIALAILGGAPFADGAQVLLNGTLSTSDFAFKTFLDNTTAGSQAWSFRADATTTLAAINTGGVLSTLAPEAVTTAGSSTISFTNAINAPLGGFIWSGEPDQAARDAMTNGSGFHSGGATMTINIPSSVAADGGVYHVELLAFAGFGANPRVMNIASNGINRVTNWSVFGGDPFNLVLEFDAVADASGITLIIDPGTDPGDSNPYVGALAITPIPEPGSMALLGLGGLGLILRRRRQDR